MKPTFAAHQRAQDDAAELEAHAEQLEQQARETLLAMNTFDYVVKQRFFTAPASKSGFDVMEAAIDLGGNEIELAFSLLDSDPLEAVRILKEVRTKAVEDVLGRIDFNEAADVARQTGQEDAA